MLIRRSKTGRQFAWKCLNHSF